MVLASLVLSSLIIIALLAVLVFRPVGQIAEPTEPAATSQVQTPALEQRTLTQGEEFQVPSGWSCTADIEVSTSTGWINPGGDLILFEREVLVRAPHPWGAYCSSSSIEEKVRQLREFNQQVEIIVVK